MKWAVIFSIALMAISCKTAEFGFKATDLNGMVYDFSNKPVANCEISLGEKHNSVTDINGRFSLPKVPLGTHIITGFKKAFESYSEEIIVKDKGQIVYIRIPSLNQLLNLADEALSANDFVTAEEMLERTYQIDQNNMEMLFYYAAVKFRQREYDNAQRILESARDLGSRDVYIDKFLAKLKELRNAQQED